MWNLKKKKFTDELIYKTRNTVTDVENKLLVTKGGGDKLDVGIDIYELLYIKWVANMDPPVPSLHGK